MALAAQSLIGLVAFPLVAWLLSEDRTALGWRTAVGFALACIAVQYGLALVLTQLPWAAASFAALGQGVAALQSAVDVGSRFVFGYLAGGDMPFETSRPEANFIIAFRVLPMILLLSALIRLLYYWGVVQRVVLAMARLLKRTLGIGGPLATGAAASVFLGTVETPMVVRPYLATMSRGALFALITTTMATVAGTVLALYASVLASTVPGAAGHVLTASLVNVPAALLIARLMVPAGFDEGPAETVLKIDDAPGSGMEAIVQGTTDGVAILGNVIGMLIVSFALVALVNAMLAAVTVPFGQALTLQQVLGWAMAPFALAMGIPVAEAATAGSLLGLKLTLNEFVAYLEMGKLPPADLSPRSRLILTYAMCGFANLASLGISIGGLVAMVPERRAELVGLVPKAVLAGILATMLSGAVIGTLTWS